MKDKDKIIIVVYVGGGDDPYETYHAIIETQKNIKDYFDDTVKLIFAPDFGNFGIKFECINPVLVNEDEYKKVEETALKLENLLKNLIEKQNDEK